MTAHVILWGRMPIKRSAIPEQLADLSHWPGVDRTALADGARTRYDRQVNAVTFFVEQPGVPLAEIERRTGVKRGQLYRLMDLCLRKHDDGRIQGFRGLLPYKHLKEYERRTKVAATKPRGQGGSAGALQLLLDRVPVLRRWLVRQARQRNQPLRQGEVREVRKTLRHIHKQFLQQCTKLGFKETDWPFNRDERGYRSLQAFIYREQRSPTAERRDATGDAPGEISSESPEVDNDDGWHAAALPFDAVQFDGHKLDLRLTLRFIDPFGMESLFELTRIFILVCIDVVTRAVLGYHIVLSQEYDSDDIAHALQACFGPHRGPALTIPGLSVREGGGYPSNVCEEQARYPGWCWFQYDNAKANLSEATLGRLSDIVGCYIHAGRLGEPNDRPFIERFFATVARLGLHRVPGTTGSSIDDVVRRLGDLGSDLALAMTVDELEQVVEVMLADYNGESHGGLGGRTPLQAMRYWLSKPGVRIRALPAQKRRQLIFLQEARIVTLRGEMRPYVNFEGVRYTSDVLASKADLRGKKIRIYFNTQDIRQLHAFFEDGTELGILIASRAWRRTAHSLRQRREILRLVRLGKLRYRADEDAVETYALYKRRQARTSKKAANSLAELQQTAQRGSHDAPGLASPSPAREAPTDARFRADTADEPTLAPASDPVDTASAAAAIDDTPPVRKVLSVRRTITF